MRYLLLLFSHPIVSNSLKPHGLEHARPPRPSPSPGVCLSSCSLHWWCRPAILSSDALFSFCIRSFPASGTFPVQFTSVTQLCLTLCDPMDCSTPDFPVHHQLLEFTQTCVHWVGDAIQSSHPLLSPCSPSFNLSQHQGLFKWVSSSHQVAKYWSFSFNISPSNEHLRLISFRMDWLGLLAVQGTLKSLLQHHSSKAPIIQCSASFIVQLSHPYMTTGKTIALTRQTDYWQNNVSAF